MSIIITRRLSVFKYVTSIDQLRLKARSSVITAISSSRATSLHPDYSFLWSRFVAYVLVVTLLADAWYWGDLTARLHSMFRKQHTVNKKYPSYSRPIAALFIKPNEKHFPFNSQWNVRRVFTQIAVIL